MNVWSQETNEHSYEEKDGQYLNERKALLSQDSSSRDPHHSRLRPAFHRRRTRQDRSHAFCLRRGSGRGTGGPRDPSAPSAGTRLLSNAWEAPPPWADGLSHQALVQSKDTHRYPT